MWQPLAAEEIQVMGVSSRAIEGARRLLVYHQSQIEEENQPQKSYHQTMIRHYHMLLARWELSHDGKHSI